MKKILNKFIKGLFSDKSIARFISLLNIFFISKFTGVLLIAFSYGFLNLSESNQDQILSLLIIPFIIYTINNYTLKILKRRGVVVWSKLNECLEYRLIFSIIKAMFIIAFAIVEFNRVLIILNI